jgi:hypothetical protein
VNLVVASVFFRLMSPIVSFVSWRYLPLSAGAPEFSVNFASTR